MYKDDYNVESVIKSLNDVYGFKSAKEHEEFVEKHLDHIEDYFKSRKGGGIELTPENIEKHKDYLMEYLNNPNKEGGFFTQLKQDKSKIVVLVLMIVAIYLIVK